MSLVTNQKSLYLHAIKNNYTIPAFNCFDIESMRAVLDAAVEEDSPAVLQLCLAMREKVKPMEKFVKYVRDYLSDVGVPVLLHHDHMQTYDQCIEAVNMGIPSIMFDGSHLPYNENVDITSRIVEYAHKYNVWVEAELGSIPGFEDMIFSSNSIYTDPEQAKDFIEKTGCDSLSVAVGTAHGGVRADKHLEINFDLLQKIREKVGAEYPLVFHGAASLPKEYIDEVNRLGGEVEYLMMCTEETISKARFYGVAKANMDVDNFLKYTYSIRKSLTEQPDQFNPFIYNSIASGFMKDACRHKMSCVTKSSGFGSTFNKESGT